MYLVSAPLQKFTFLQPYCVTSALVDQEAPALPLVDRGWGLPSSVVAAVECDGPVTPSAPSVIMTVVVAATSLAWTGVPDSWLQPSSMSRPVASATSAFYLDWLPSTSDIPDFHKIVQDVILQRLRPGEVNPYHKGITERKGRFDSENKKEMLFRQKSYVWELLP